MACIRLTLLAMQLARRSGYKVVTILRNPTVRSLCAAAPNAVRICSSSSSGGSSGEGSSSEGNNGGVVMVEQFCTFGAIERSGSSSSTRCSKQLATDSPWMRSATVAAPRPPLRRSRRTSSSSGDSRITRRDASRPAGTTTPSPSTGRIASSSRLRTTTTRRAM